MSDYTLDDTYERRDYRSYLLRLWRVGTEEAAWRDCSKFGKRGG
jgi:hypothetical protein